MAAPIRSIGERLLSNLRDLEMDDTFSWPDIGANTFDGRDSVQNQAIRIKKAEYLMYWLLHRWDAHIFDKMAKSLFPPHDSRCSLELRAHLFQKLSEMKGNGVLGKAITVRKTMLDDCKGRNFEELLLALSTCVLLKRCSMDRSDRSIAKKILLDEVSVDAQSLQVMNAAYRASISHDLEGRAKLSKRLDRFGRVLKVKEKEISQRRLEHDKKLEHIRLQRIPKRRIDSLKAHIKSDRVGSHAWTEILLRSDQHLQQNSLLERPFSEVWDHACTDSMYHLRPSKNQSLLHNLENQCAQQVKRLDKWRKVKAGLEAGKADKASLDAQKSKVERLLSAKPADLGVVEDERASESHRQRQLPLALQPHDTSMTPYQEVNRHTGDNTSTALPAVYIRRSAGSGDESLENFDQEDDVVDRVIESIVGAAPSPQKVMSTLTERTALSMAKMSPRKSPPRPAHVATGSPTRGVPTRQESVSPTRKWPTRFRPGSPGKAAIPNTSRPGVATLDERTRQSMAAMIPRPMRSESTSPTKETNAGTATLDERTRQSMSQVTARPHISRRNTKNRTSVAYPTNQWGGASEDMGETSYLEALGDGEEDVSKVFGSKPKIRHSPIMKPVEQREEIPSLSVRDDESVEDFS